MGIELTDEQRRNYLKDEYFFLQNQYEDYDKRSLTIKGWSSTGAIAALALAFNVDQKAGGLIVPILVGVIVAVVWYLEAYWKMFQYAFADRIRVIEAFFRGEPDILIKNPEPFQVYNTWFKSYMADEPIYEYEKSYRPASHSKRLARVAFQRFVCLPYLPILFLCLIAFAGILLRQSK